MPDVDDRVLASSETRLSLVYEVEWRRVDSVRVKGKSKPNDLFEPIGVKGRVDSIALELRYEYEVALEHFQSGRFAEAGAKLEAALNMDRHDQPTKRLMGRAASFEATPPSDDWHGITDFDVK